MSDYLGEQLAAEEHRQGRPYLADPDHCQRCAEVDRAWQMAVCEHGETVSVRGFDNPHDVRLCQLCGTLRVISR